MIRKIYKELQAIRNELYSTKNAMEPQKTDAEKLKLPHVRIENKGAVTKVFVDGKEVPGVKNVSFSHSRTGESKLPILRIELLTERICIDSPQIFELPEVYHPHYVSSDKLIQAGILTLDELNEMLSKGLL